MSLRARLLVASIALVVVGLVVADVTTYSAVRSFLLDRVDAQLDGADRSVERALFTRDGVIVDAALRQLSAIAPGVYVQVRNAADEALVTVEGRGRDEPPTSPRLPAGVVALVADLRPASPVQPAPLRPRQRARRLPGAGDPAGPGTAVDGGADQGEGRFSTVAAVEEGGPHYRVRLSAIGAGGALVVALPLRDTDATLRRLVGIEVLVTLGVALFAAALGLWLVRLGLRPLADIEATAATITSGDMTQRVRRDDDRTEVGRLGGALNVMLDRIDVAFAERRASEEAARRSEQQVRRFVADASHELRTPVAAVRAYAELYRRGADERPEDLARLLSRIEHESERMGVLVDDLLLLTRLDEGRPLDRAPVDLGAVAADAVAAARAVEPDRPLDLDVVGSVEVLGDRGRLRQVLDNLLANVRSHTQAGVAASVRVAAEGNDAVVEVADRGPGLDEEQAAHVFERFYRADPSRSRDGGGSGLGLSIVAAIASAHGGSASAAPREGGGAVFRIRLPLLEAHG